MYHNLWFLISLSPPSLPTFLSFPHSRFLPPSSPPSSSSVSPPLFLPPPFLPPLSLPPILPPSPSLSYPAGCSSAMDISSLSSGGQLLLFSAGALSYGLLSDIAVLSRDFTWLGNRRVELAQVRALMSKRWGGGGWRGREEEKIMIRVKMRVMEKEACLCKNRTQTCHLPKLL